MTIEFSPIFQGREEIGRLIARRGATVEKIQSSLTRRSWFGFHDPGVEPPVYTTTLRVEI